MIFFLFGTYSVKNKVTANINGSTLKKCAIRNLGAYLTDGKEMPLPCGLNEMQIKFNRITDEEIAKYFLIDNQEKLLEMLKKSLDVILLETQAENIIIKVPNVVLYWPNKNEEEQDFSALKQAKKIFSQNGEAKAIYIKDLFDNSIISSLNQKYEKVPINSARPDDAIKWILAYINRDNEIER